MSGNETIGQAQDDAAQSQGVQEDLIPSSMVAELGAITTTIEAALEKFELNSQGVAEAIAGQFQVDTNNAVNGLWAVVKLILDIQQQEFEVFAREVKKMKVK